RGDNLAVTFAVADGSKTLGRLQGNPARPVPRRSGRGRRGRARCVRRVQGRYRARQARRNLYAQGSRRRPEEAGRLEGRLRPQAFRGRDEAGAGSREMIAETGHFALVLALALALIQSTVPLVGARRGDVALMNVARSTALAQLLFTGASFALLVMLHVISDFS